MRNLRAGADQAFNSTAAAYHPRVQPPLPSGALVKGRAAETSVRGANRLLPGTITTSPRWPDGMLADLWVATSCGHKLAPPSITFALGPTSVPVRR